MTPDLQLLSCYHMEMAKSMKGVQSPLHSLGFTAANRGSRLTAKWRPHSGRLCTSIDWLPAPRLPLPPCLWWDLVRMFLSDTDAILHSTFTLSCSEDIFKLIQAPLNWYCEPLSLSASPHTSSNKMSRHFCIY